MSVTSNVTSDLFPSHFAAQWLDVDLYAVGWKVCVAPKNLNRKWLYQCVSRGEGEFAMREKMHDSGVAWEATDGFCTLGKWGQDENCACTFFGTV